MRWSSARRLVSCFTSLGRSSINAVLFAKKDVLLGFLCEPWPFSALRGGGGAEGRRGGRVVSFKGPREWQSDSPRQQGCQVPVSQALLPGE